MRYEKRLEVLVQRRGLCPVPMTPLWCAHCHTTWSGSTLEPAELLTLWDRLEPSVIERRLESGPSRRCGSVMGCLACRARTPPQAGIPAGLYSAAEAARFRPLVALMRVTPGPAQEAKG